MSMVDDEYVYYYVSDEKMCSGRELGRVSLESTCPSSHDSASIFEILFETDIIPSHVPANGTYVLLSGMRVMREEDIFKTKEDAAEAYRIKLLG